MADAAAAALVEAARPCDRVEAWVLPPEAPRQQRPGNSDAATSPRQQRRRAAAPGDGARRRRRRLGRFASATVSPEAPGDGVAADVGARSIAPSNGNVRYLNDRLFKVRAIAENAALFPGGTLYTSRAELEEAKPVLADCCSIGMLAPPSFLRRRSEHERTSPLRYLDNDVTLNRRVIGKLFAIFDRMAAKGKAVGLVGLDTTRPTYCVPGSHMVDHIPKSFCERNGGQIFFGPGAEATAIARDWLHELRDHQTPDGHDQMPLRKVLWRHRDALYDLNHKAQCRKEPADVQTLCNRTLVWHWHRKARVEWAEANELDPSCGYVV